MGSIEASVKEKLAKMEKQLKRSNEEISDLKLDLNEYEEQEKSQALEIKMLREQKALLNRTKTSGKDKTLLDSLNAQIARDADDILEVRNREAQLQIDL